MCQRQSLENTETLFPKLPREAIIKALTSFRIKMIDIANLPMDIDHFFQQLSSIPEHAMVLIYPRHVTQGDQCAASLCPRLFSS
jgi:hypothetical protein